MKDRPRARYPGYVSTEGDPTEALARTRAVLGRVGTLAVGIITVLAGVSAVNFDRASGEVRIPLWVLVLLAIALVGVAVVLVMYMYFEHRRLWQGISYWRGEAGNLEKIVTNLEDLAYFDPITGLPNANALARSLEGGSNDNRCLILMDLVNFGSVNKRHSHWKGDEYLRNFSTMISSDSRRNEYIYKSRPTVEAPKRAAGGGSPLDAVEAFRRNDGGDEFYVLLRGSIVDGLGYLNRLQGRARAFNDMAERVLGSPHPFGFRAGLIALGKDESFDDATARVSDCLLRTMKVGSEYLVDWGRIQGDDRTPEDYEDKRFAPGTMNANILGKAKENFAIEAQ